MTVHQKLQVVQKVLKEGSSVSSVCRKFGISRKTFYEWRKRYLAAAPRDKSSCLEKRHLRGLQHPRGKKDLFKYEILRIVAAHPDWGSHKISKILFTRNKKLGNHGVYTLLKTLGLETEERRKEFSGLHRTLNHVRDRFAPGPRRLLNQARKRMAEDVLLTGKKVNQVAEDFKVSRKTVWKWVNRYRQAQGKQASILPFLADQHPTAWAHPRGTPERLERKILNLVAVHPEYSCQHLRQEIRELGHHGIQNVLWRNGLSTYQKRLAFAKTWVSAPTYPVFAWLNRLKTVFETFVPQLAPAPPLRLKRSVTIFLLSFAFSSILSLLFLTWLQTFSGQPIPARLGLLFATFSLTFGLFFFLYSLKYYFTLILILGFSRQVSGPARLASESVAGGGDGNQESGNGNGNGPLTDSAGSLQASSGYKGILERLFGVKINGNGAGNGNGHGKAYGGGITGGLQPDLSQVTLSRQPFVSIHLPMYNEKRVVDRLLTASTSQDYPNYEVVVIDDSTDETTQILRSNWQGHPKVKIIHRESREGYKGGALQEALKISDPRTEFVVVFDADFLPYPDTITQFLKYFQVTAGTLRFDSGQALDFSPGGRTSQKKMPLRGSTSPIPYTLYPKPSVSPIAAVQGYQWHVLNKSENWITKGVRAEYAGSYVIERSGTEALGALKQIAGSVYMIRRDILQRYGWGTSITEDFELTLRLHRDGFKVVYTPYIQTPSECVSTLRRLIRQRMRWAEGHSHNIKKMFRQLMWGRWEILDAFKRSVPALQGRTSLGREKVWIPSKLTLMEKLEFAYLSPYYLQAAFFMLGTLSWFISESVFKTRLPFWTSIWGWSLVFTNLFSLPLMNTVGLFLEESEERDYMGVLSFITLSYLLVPFQGYAALKGFLEKEEGPWFRTPKTGRITDIFTPGRFYRFITGIFGRPSPASAGYGAAGRLATAPVVQRSAGLSLNSYLALATANNHFNGFQVKPRRLRWVAKVAIALLLCFSVSLFTLARNITVVQATPTTNKILYIETDASAVLTGSNKHQLRETSAGSCDTGQSVKHGKNTYWIQVIPDTGTNTTNAGTVSPCPSSATGNGWIFDTPFQTNGTLDGNFTFRYYFTGTAYSANTGRVRVCAYRIQVSGGALGTSTSLFGYTGTTADAYPTAGSEEQEDTATDPCIAGCTFTATENYLYFDFYVNSDNIANSGAAITAFGEDQCGTTSPRITISSFLIPEKLTLFLLMVPFIPMMVLWMKKRKETILLR